MAFVREQVPAENDETSGLFPGQPQDGIVVGNASVDIAGVNKPDIFRIAHKVNPSTIQ